MNTSDSSAKPVILPTTPTQVPAWAQQYRAGEFPPYAYTADVIELAVDLEGETLRGLFVERGQPPYSGDKAWPGGFVAWRDDSQSISTRKPSAGYSSSAEKRRIPVTKHGQEASSNGGMRMPKSPGSAKSP